MKVLLVDDHPVVRAGLHRLLAAEPEVEVLEAAGGREALHILKERRPNIVILDLNLPGISGLEVIARLKTADPAVQILVLSMHDDYIHVTRALQAGVAGYVSKNAPPEEILEAIKRIAGGHTYIEHGIAEELAFSGIRTPSHPLKDLSSRDLEILRLLAQGCTLSQIADAIGIGYKTVANNCSQIKVKLGAATMAQLIRIALQSGLAPHPHPLSGDSRT
jgi:two-component system, NarL family, invasion response regulator UvrY